MEDRLCRKRCMATQSRALTAVSFWRYLPLIRAALISACRGRLSCCTLISSVLDERKAPVCAVADKKKSNVHLRKADKVRKVRLSPPFSRLNAKFFGRRRMQEGGKAKYGILLSGSAHCVDRSPSNPLQNLRHQISKMLKSIDLWPPDPRPLLR